MAASPVVVIGGGVAGCAAAVAAAKSGVPTILIEATRQLGGVAVQGEHRTLCGLAPIDAAAPDLLEPDLTGEWIPFIATGTAIRHGRVWLWPTTAPAMQAGLRRRLADVGVACRMGIVVVAAEVLDGVSRLHLSDGRVAEAAAVVDASGGPTLARLLGLPCTGPTQWPAHRSRLHLPGLGTGTAARVAAVRRAQAASGGDAALALVPLDPTAHLWQLSLDVLPGSALSAAAATAERIATALGGSVIDQAVAIAERDHGRPIAALGLDGLFSERERGLCWAAWPREEHGPAGITWTWPVHDRHGVPERAVRIPGTPAGIWCVGKGTAVTAEAAAALRVTGTCLALGTAVGRRAALSARPDHAR
jgi:2-polyprenyl-6-methoxyphenol hydroxylase-like FAD-dependent oxidoreductase